MKKILIIDNSIAIRNIIRNLFTDNQRILIYEANSKEETEKLIKENKFFIIISNLFLNDSSDLEILNLFEKENIPTIIFSSVLETELLNKYSNIIDYVIKDSNGFKYIYKIVSAMTVGSNAWVTLISPLMFVSIMVCQSSSATLCAGFGDKARPALFNNVFTCLNPAGRSATTFCTASLSHTSSAA
jgi:DNA-binding NarL/FixJ family response regulator